MSARRNRKRPWGTLPRYCAAVAPAFTKNFVSTAPGEPTMIVFTPSLPQVIFSLGTAPE